MKQLGMFAPEPPADRTQGSSQRLARGRIRVERAEDGGAAVSFTASAADELVVELAGALIGLRRRDYPAVHALVRMLAHRGERSVRVWRDPRPSVDVGALTRASGR